MDYGTYTRNILIEKQKDGRYAILLQSNLWAGQEIGGTSYALIGVVGPESPLITLADCTARRVE